MLILGLTGDIACGKSTVGRWLQARGARLLDADLLVRELYADPVFARQVAALFENATPLHEYSCSATSANATSANATSANATSANATSASLTDAQSRFLLPDGTINRATLGNLVFNDALALRRLEELVHPAVAALRERKIAALRNIEKPPRVVVLEAVKLIESGQALSCDQIWWIVCDAKVQLRRLMENRGLSGKEARLRLAQQPDREAKHALLGNVPCAVIENNESLAELENHVAKSWERLAMRFDIGGETSGFHGL